MSKKTHLHTLTPRQLCDLELILNGGFAPLTGFLGKKDYLHVLQHNRLSNQSLWPIPITLDVDKEAADKMALHDQLQLQDEEGIVIADMTITEMYEVDKNHEAEAVYGTQDKAHPGVNYLINQTKTIYIAGPISLIHQPQRRAFSQYYHTPAALKNFFTEHKIKQIVGFQTRNPMHRAHQELTMRAAKELDACLLLHPVVGQTKPGDIDSQTRIKCYQLLLKYYPIDQAVKLSFLPLAMRMAGPKEALWHALIRKNYGCTHFIIGRDHAGPGKNPQGENFYGAYEAQEFAMRFTDEININLVPFEEMNYVKSKKTYLTSSEIATDPSIKQQDIASISGSELRNLLHSDGDIPHWFSYPDIVAELKRTVPPLHQQGLALFFTGLPSSGKSTIANALLHKLMELTSRTISLLDGDLFRRLFSHQLGFSKKDRDENVKRVAYFAAEITKHRGIVICALIAPYADARDNARQIIGQYGQFIEIYLATPLATCEQRDPKGLYKKARKKEIQHFTGIDDPYEPPCSSEIMLDTSDKTVEECVEQIIQKLKSLKLI